MNYLGHLILSGNNSEITFGNFIADSLKGKTYLKYSKKIQKGVILHRKIDELTDTNVHYLNGKRRFYKNFPKMGGVINDILYDHLLWRFEKKTRAIHLECKIDHLYKILDDNFEKMPDPVKYMYQYMRRDDWLRNYQYEEGIKKALNGIGKRINYSNNLELSFEIAKSSMKFYDKEFELFYHDIKEKTSIFVN